MKVVKIILWVIVTLSIVFFGTGIFVKDICYTSDILIDKPLDSVFSKFQDVNQQSKWLKEIKEIKVLNENPQHIGSLYELSVDNSGKVLTIKQKVLEYISNNKLTYRFNSDVLVRTENYTFETVNTNQVKLIQDTQIRSMAYMLSCTIPWFKFKFKEGSLSNLQKFKNYVEHQK